MAEGGATSTTANGGENEEPDHVQGSSQAMQCQSCGRNYTKKYEIQCNRCKELYHMRCVNLTKKQADQIPRYECRTCRGVAAPNRAPAIAENQTPDDFNLLHHLRSCKSNLSIISNIPKGARTTAANALSDLINNVVESNTSLSWAKLLCFANTDCKNPRRKNLRQTDLPW